ncbi:MAG: Crp/Fnr family transcriptional regulator [Bacillota bacterium]|nr:Crp/Fnr family transcriptional regulator [Bacillota bacterium]
MENRIKEFSRGEVVFYEGDFETCMYHLQKGSLGIYANYGTPEEKLLTELHAGEMAILGEMGFLESKPRSATAVALEDAQLRVITRVTFAMYFKENPVAVMQIMQNMSKRIRDLTEDYLDACRAVTEAMESRRAGEPEGWFSKKFDKYIRDYEDANMLTEQDGVNVDYYINHKSW